MSRTMFRYRRRGGRASGVIAGMAGVLVVFGVGYFLMHRGKADSEESPEVKALASAEIKNNAARGTDVVVPTTAPSVSPGPVPLAGAPPIVFDPPEMNLGFVSPNQVHKGEVTIHNPTDRPLRILATRASCTCTSVDLANQVIPPRGSIPLVAEFDAGSRLGQKKAAVRVLIEGYKEVAVVNLVALVSLTVRAEPSYLIANRVKAGVDTTTQRPQAGDFEPVTYGEYEVISQDERPFTILKVNGRPPTFLDYNPRAEGPRNRYRLSWDLTEYDENTCRNAANQPMPAWWVIETDHPDCPIFDMQVRHDCTMPPPPAPERIWFFGERRVLIGQWGPGELIDFEVPIRWYPDADRSEEFIAIQSESTQFQVELRGISQTGDKTICRIRITPDPAHRGVIYGSLRLYSRQTSSPLLIIGKVAGN